MSIKGESRESNHTPDLFTNDLTLTQAVATGSVRAWHGFIERYSGSIYGVVRRHLVAGDEDDIRAVHVDVLHALYHRELAKFRGDVRLTTWLIVYTRSRSLDFLRQRHGRYRLPEGYEKLTDLEKKVLELHFVKQLSFDVSLHVLEWGGFETSVEDVVRCIERIEDVMDRRYLNRLERQQQVQRCGADSARMLQYLIQLRLDYEEKMRSERPDEKLAESEGRAVTERLARVVASLTTREREIVDLRLNRRLSAREIAVRLKLNGQRRAYTLIDKVVRKLRRAMETERQL